MDILGLTLGQVKENLRHQHGKGLYHANALYREVFKRGGAGIFKAQEFKASPALTREIEGKINIAPGRIAGTTKEDHLTKFITELSDGLKIESVIIPMTNHQTLCLSSQVGCRMGCRFCQTSLMGFKRNLTPAEITGQLFNARFALNQDIKNIVFMGMGEPFDNFESVIQAVKVMNEQRGFDIALRHMTISTAGLSDGIKKLGSMNMPGIRLALSLNSGSDTQRSRLMPVNNVHGLDALKKVLSGYPLPKRGCFLFEYILIKGLNDSEKDAINIVDFIGSLPVRLNLIPYNPVEGVGYQSPCDQEMHKFADILSQHGVFVIKRWTRGRSVSAGCGQLGKSAMT